MAPDWASFFWRFLVSAVFRQHLSASSPALSVAHGGMYRRLEGVSVVRECDFNAVALFTRSVTEPHLLPEYAVWDTLSFQLDLALPEAGVPVSDEGFPHRYQG